MTGTRRLRGLVFDVGDIFFDATAWRRWLAMRLSELGIDIDYPGLVRLWEGHLLEVYRGNAEYWTAFREMLVEIALPSSAPSQLIEEAKTKGRQVLAGRQPFPEVIETLAELKQTGLRLAALTDSESPGERTRHMLEELGIARYLDAVISSRDIGHAKPDPEAYKAAAQALGLEVRECGFVGHDLDELEGANAAGMFSIAFNASEPVTADVVLKSFSELRSVVAG